MASDTVTQLLQDILGTLLNAYTDFFQRTTFNPLVWLLDTLLLQMLLRQVVRIVPYLDRITSALFAPFSFLHKWTHIHKAMQITASDRKIKERIADDIQAFPAERWFYPKIALRPTFGLGVGDRENAGLAMIVNEDLSLKDVSGLAYAPLKYGLAASLLCYLTSPMIGVQFIFTLIHAYLYVGALLYLFPSDEDFRLVMNTLLANNTVSPGYVFHGITIFAVIGFAGIFFFGEIDYPAYWFWEVLRVAVTATVVYYAGLMLALRLTGPDLRLKPTWNTRTATKIVEEWKGHRAAATRPVTVPPSNEGEFLSLISDEDNEFG